MNKEYYVQGENLLISDENGKLRMTSYTSSSKKILESQNRIEIFQNEIQQHALQIKEKLEQIRKSKLNSALWVIGAFFSMGFAIYGIPYFSKMPFSLTIICNSFLIGLSVSSCSQFYLEMKNRSFLKQKLETAKVEEFLIGQKLQSEKKQMQQLEKKLDKPNINENFERINNDVDLRRLKNLLECIRFLNEDKKLNSALRSRKDRMFLYNEYNYLVSEEEFNDILDTYRLVRKEKKLK